MLSRPVKLKRYSCEECGKVELKRGGSAYHTCIPCMRNNPLKHWKLKEILSGQREAARSVAEAIRYGRLRRAYEFKCSDCDSMATVYDHRDYRKPLSVEPVCRRCNLSRGYAIPADGFISECVSLGIVPYGRKSHLASLLERMGVSSHVLDGMPAYLDINHWQAIFPAISGPTKDAAHA